MLRECYLEGEANSRIEAALNYECRATMAERSAFGGGCVKKKLWVEQLKEVLEVLLPIRWRVDRSGVRVHELNCGVTCRFACLGRRAS
jgi:hypothetical protein